MRNKKQNFLFVLFVFKSNISFNVSLSTVYVKVKIVLLVFVCPR